MGPAGLPGYFGSFLNGVDSQGPVVGFSSTVTSVGVTVESGDQITFAHAGTYALTFDVEMACGDSSACTGALSLTQNGSLVSGSVTRATVPAGGVLPVSRTIVVTVAAGDYVQLNIGGSQVTLSSDTNSPSASVNVVQLAN